MESHALDQTQPSSEGSAAPTHSVGQPCATTERPLFVDLDGTLIATDLLHEGFLRAIRQQPLVLLLMPHWLRQGLAMFKQQIAELAPVNAETLPYRNHFVAHLMAERARGRPIILATASPEQWARPVAEYLGCFDDIIASDTTHNRKSTAKLAAIRKWCEQRGHRDFDYCGDSSADRVLWATSKVAVLVGRGTRFRSELTMRGIACTEFATTIASPATIWRAERPWRWVKNLIVFVPLWLTASTASHWLTATITYFAFCAVASAGYVINDAFDLDSDRRHPTKQHRPLATGLMNLPQGLKLAVCLLSLAGMLAACAGSTSIAATLAGYVVVSTLYSAWLKTVPIVNLVCLASLSTSRLLAGSLASPTPLAGWVLLAALLSAIALHVAWPRGD